MSNRNKLHLWQILQLPEETPTCHYDGPHTLNFSLMQTLSLSLWVTLTQQWRLVPQFLSHLSAFSCTIIPARFAGYCMHSHAILPMLCFLDFPPSQLYNHNSCTLHHYIFKMYNYVTQITTRLYFLQCFKQIKISRTPYAYKTDVGQVKCSISTMPWRGMGEWKYSSMHS